jgi:hypothetical protein
LDPGRWPDLVTRNVIISGNKELKVKGFTNDTAIETRVVDVERGLSNQEDHQSSSANREAASVERPPFVKETVSSNSKSHVKHANMLGESEEDSEALPEEPSSSA